MAKQTKITADKIVEFYSDYVLENDGKPASIYSFCKLNGFEEKEFYEHFGTFEALEAGIFEMLFDATNEVLQKNKDYEDYDAREQLLSFYYTFVENLTANRSLVVYLLDAEQGQMKSFKVLQGLKRSFITYFNELAISTLDLRNDQLEKIKDRTLQESAWLQLLLTIKFWMDDSSPAFQKTDIFIEKSVNASFDLLDTTPLKSLFDLGKFIYKEKIQMN